MAADIDVGEELLKDAESPYFIDDDGYLCRWKTVKEGDIPVRLANFEARIIDEVSEDDGIEVKTLYGVEGSTSRRPLPRIEIPASQFNAMHWIPKWGSQCIMEPGQSIKDYVRHAIQTRSNGIQRETLFTHRLAKDK